MGAIRDHEPVLPILALFSRDEPAIEWGIATAAAAWGDVLLRSEPFPFDDTEYYAPTMGTGLRKVLVAFKRLFDPVELPQRKHQANVWESAYAEAHSHDVPRPLNLDPGYLTLAKFVLATTKDRQHRLYLGHGIFAECTLYYHRGAWRDWPWTYPDYRRKEYHAFFEEARAKYRELRNSQGRV